MIKIVSLFLVGMMILAILGRLRVPGAKRLQAAKCKGCGRYKFGKGPCACGRDG
ncbi:MAG: hypothetical protein AAF871_12265 [Pseudomonadota bacterium]